MCDGRVIVAENNPRLLALIAVAHATNHAYQLTLPMAIPSIALEYGLSNFWVGVLVASYNLAYILLQAPFGTISDRIGRKRLLTMGFIIASAAYLAIGFTKDLTTIAILLAIAGLGGSTYHPLGIAFIADLYKEGRGQAMGFHQAGGSLGSFLAPLAVGIILIVSEWRYAFLYLAAVGLLLAPILWLLLKEPQAVFKADRRGFSLRMYSQALFLIVASAIFTIALRGVVAFAPKYFIDIKKADSWSASVLFSSLQVAGIFSAPMLGRLSDTLGRRAVIASLVIVQAASLFVLTLTDGTPLFLACIVFGLASYGLLATSDAFLSDISPRESFGMIFGLNLTASYATSVVIPPMLGRSIDVYGFDLSLTLMNAASMVSLVPLSLVKRTSKAS